MENYNSDYRSRLIKKNVEFYGPRLSDLDSNNKKVSWNWFAFLVPFVWFAYRKLYLECIAYYLLTNGLHTVINSIFVSHGIEMNVGWTIDILGMFFSGLYGNWLYKNKLDKQVEKCIQLSPEKRDQYIERHGGTSVLAIIIAFCITMAIAFVLYKINPASAVATE